MPEKICRKCGRMTNTAVCDWLDSPDEKADRCFAAFVDGRWVEGCGFHDTDEYARLSARLVCGILKPQDEKPEKPDDGGIIDEPIEGGIIDYEPEDWLMKPPEYDEED